MYANISPTHNVHNQYPRHYGFRNPYRRESLDTVQRESISTDDGRNSLRCDAKYMRLFLRKWEWKEILHEYTQNSSLHGLRYMGNTELHIAER